MLALGTLALLVSPELSMVVSCVLMEELRGVIVSDGDIRRGLEFVLGIVLTGPFA